MKDDYILLIPEYSPQEMIPAGMKMRNSAFRIEKTRSEAADDSCASTSPVWKLCLM